MRERFKIEGMTCSACAAGIQKIVKKLSGVASVQVNILSKEMVVDYNPSELAQDKIVSAVQSLGYGIFLQNDDSALVAAPKREDREGEARQLQRRFLLSICFLIPLLYFTMGQMLDAPLPAFLHTPVNLALVQLILTGIIVFINFHFFKSGIMAVIKKVPNMDTLVCLGATASTLYSVVIFFIVGQETDAAEAMRLVHNNLFFESAAMILTLVTLGKWLEAQSKKKTGDEIQKLLNLAPAEVVVERENSYKTIPLKDLRIGDIVVVRQGENIPADGKVVEGSSFIDKSAITGESIPIEIEVGDYVTSATVNRGNVIKVSVEKVGEDTVLSKIIKMVQEAGTSKAPIEKTVDKIAAIFVPVVLGIALITFVVWLIIGAVQNHLQFNRALNMAISVLVISCPCALGLATPVAVMAATGRGAALGILFKNAEVFERTKNIKIMVLDKTATLTEGTLKITDILCFGDATKEKVLSLAASVEKNSNHPIAMCVLQEAKERKVPILNTANFLYTSGKGASADIDGEMYRIGNKKLMSENLIDITPFEGEADALLRGGKTVLYFAKDQKLMALIAVADIIKPESKTTVQALDRSGILPVMLTGDASEAAKAVASQVGIQKVYAEVLPEDKLKIVQELKKSSVTAMVGDGINDAPALKEADVGIAMGDGTDVAIDSADIVLVGGRLQALPVAVSLSRATVKNIHENLFWAFLYNSIGIPIAAGVLSAVNIVLNPMIGAAAMGLSSLFVVSNALRLRNFKDKSYGNELEKCKGEKKMKTIITIEGMMCSHCSARIEAALKEIKGISVTVELKKKRAIVEGDAEDSVLIQKIEEAGYSVKKIIKQ